MKHSDYWNIQIIYWNAFRLYMETFKLCIETFRLYIESFRKIKQFNGKNSPHFQLPRNKRLAHTSDHHVCQISIQSSACVSYLDDFWNGQRIQRLDVNLRNIFSLHQRLDGEEQLFVTLRDLLWIVSTRDVAPVLFAASQLSCWSVERKHMKKMRCRRWVNI